ncbi:phage antirepressor KilAC domain-containing protein [Listeria monocytogenes]|uniref:phage antirepressor n=1 Tax=Listeria monocytogenes TaxID=1639 RepID=UPI000FAC3A9C|nr:phage repressor protein/antirepressor Ant [Listeria monocytogenes]EKK7201497.1 phage antirepressor KilAC domain-containing protein [Listeria innocua]EAD4560858.1 phage repressor protein/antirepressor Ant [Listeria monocytogenes]EAF2076583.1 phage repressor protein/antirepressor Ant [Listeria monocytogenes]EAF5527612.1 phage repressor protein/antirepressor Ant [Listeria monocytogenes]
MTNLKLFNFEGSKVRTVILDEEPFFVGIDVASILGYSNPQKAMRDHCKKPAESLVNDSLGRPRRTLVLSESDVYRLVLRSDLPSAEKFENWLMDEVLPSIRKHGAYMTDDTIEKAITDPDFLIRLATNLKEEKSKRLEAEQKIEAQRPKVLFADAVSDTEGTILIRDLAKLIQQNGVDIGEKRLFEWLRQNGYLISRRGTDYNRPTQKSMELGLFKIKETAIMRSSGAHTAITAKVTGKGQIYLLNKLLEEHNQVII